MRTILSYIILSTLIISCVNENSNAKSMESSINKTSTERLIVKDTIQKVKPDSVKNYCDSINSIQNKQEIISFFYTKNYYKDSVFKYLPLCIDGEYSELFNEIYLNELKKNPSKFFDFFTKNNFNEDEINSMLNYFTEGIYDEISNQEEEANQGKSEMKVKAEINDGIYNLFKKGKVGNTNEIIKNRLKDSLLIFNKRISLN